ncbi:MAG: DUF5103 domain-containing protein [Bacteroidales bacterium]|nr:DUF5103 domain-containing protein [Bacteroidales bacterium]
MLKYLFFNLFIVSLLLMNLPATAGNFVNQNKIYDPNIVTVQLYPVGEPLKDPVIELNSNQQLQLSFDDLSNQYDSYQYTFIRCTSDWQTSSINKDDYLQGFFSENITNYQFSFNTRAGYVHYELVFPSKEMSPKLSGNYLLKVYRNENGQQQVVFTRRFFVVNPTVTVHAKESRNMIDLSENQKQQQITLNCTTPNSFSDNPQQRFNITIRQNGRWDNAKTDLHPTSVSPNSLFFDYPEGIIFNGGNEPRFFDMKSYWYLAQNIARITPETNYYKVWLHTAFPRAGQPYETYSNIMGRELITARKDQNPATEGDYAIVTFRLKIPEIPSASVYILGQVTGWNYSDENKMLYNPKTQEYEGKLFLKQGYYEYWYSVVPDGQTKGTLTRVEGNHWETNNTYTIYVYYHNRMPEYDRLVGIQTLTAQ